MWHSFPPLENIIECQRTYSPSDPPNISNLLVWHKTGMSVKDITVFPIRGVQSASQHNMVQSRAELGERSAWVWTLKAQMLHGAGGPHGHLNEEEGTHRRFLGNFFLPFVVVVGFLLIWFAFFGVFFFCLFALPQGSWTTQRKMQTWECVWRVKNEQIKNWLLPQVEKVLTPWGIWEKKCKQKTELCKALEPKQACSLSLMPQVSEN